MRDDKLWSQKICDSWLLKCTSFYVIDIVILSRVLGNMKYKINIGIVHFEKKSIYIVSCLVCKKMSTCPNECQYIFKVSGYRWHILRKQERRESRRRCWKIKPIVWINWQYWLLAVIIYRRFIGNEYLLKFSTYFAFSQWYPAINPMIWMRIKYKIS